MFLLLEPALFLLVTTRIFLPAMPMQFLLGKVGYLPQPLVAANAAEPEVACED